MPSSGMRTIWRVVAAVVVLGLLYQMLSFHGSSAYTLSPDAPPGPTNNRPTPSGCDPKVVKGMKDIFVVLKTGANEALEKVPTHFDTTLRCLPNYAIYSDLDETIEGHPVYDALADVDPNVIQNNEDFQYYNRLQSEGRATFSAQELNTWANAQNSASGRDTPGWKLDKWKFQPIAEKAYKDMPNAKWYIIMEADTYMSWRNVLEWLSHFDASQPHYIGQQMMIGDVIFAYGGAGTIFSNPTIKAVNEHRQAHLQEYNEYTAGHWAGDCVLGKAIRDININLLWAWPNLLSESPSLMDYSSDFGGGGKELWCYYAASYHHLLPQDVAWLYAWEDKWNKENSTYRHKDIFKNYVYPHIKPERADWDNDSSKQVKQGTTYEDCRRQCEMNLECIQFMLKSDDCYTDTILKLGHDKPAHPTERFASGWMMDRVNDKVAALDASCSNQNWILP